ncbi:hypothetical protein [Sphingomonas jatrophae]|uniref:Uncharacterized protein n=1 Tax=Sphingomonas jatrophae TaxID=1166337 RepID=A0A1I6JSL4_9SPHN|nr:hypothetical protein [Sphingomonas jatrophae]SFR81976.1 hypothetical protein SAMN05192580_0793 [Sphingomonas jatrophae]
MPRPLLILIAIIVAILMAMIALSTVDTEVAPTTVRKAMLNEAQPR